MRSKPVAECLRRDRGAPSWPTAPTGEVEEAEGWAVLDCASFERTEFKVEPASDPRVRLEPSPLPTADLVLVLA